VREAVQDGVRADAQFADAQCTRHYHGKDNTHRKVPWWPGGKGLFDDRVLAAYYPRATGEGDRFMIIIDVNPGVCGLCTHIECSVDGDYCAIVKVDSECKQVQRFGDALDGLTAFCEVGSPICETRVYRTASECRLHAACPVPAATIKGIEAAAGLALPADVAISLRKG